MQTTRIKKEKGTGHVLVKHWTRGVHLDENALQQAKNVAQMPFVFKHVALMPDAHLGRGATVGSVIATKQAIIPAAVGVDIGCGMAAVQLDLNAADLPDSLRELRLCIEAVIPVGNGRSGEFQNVPTASLNAWRNLSSGLRQITEKHPKLLKSAKNPAQQIGTLGGGNHFVEVCTDEDDNVWLMLHSGSRGVGNKIGSYFISKAKEEILKSNTPLAQKDLAYFSADSKNFDDYWFAVKWAQDYAHQNREVMMTRLLDTVNKTLGRPVRAVDKVINCHHNYVSLETHFDEKVFVTRKGAIKAAKGQLGIVPGSMGARSYIVRGLGNAQSFHSCSHGAGRVMSRSEAKRRFTLDDHIKATEGVECRKDSGVIDETPRAYKNIDKVMEAQKDLVETVVRLKQVVCVKG